eukprot:365800-Chlamydomonas_euryale.AAC.25
MQFTRDDGSSYVHDFVLGAGRSADAGPPAEQTGSEFTNPMEDGDSIIQPVPLQLLKDNGVMTEVDDAAVPAPVQPDKMPVTAGDERATTHPDTRNPDLAAALAEASTTATGLPSVSRGTLGELPTTIGRGSRRLRFYSWWYEDIESTDLTMRVDSNQTVGGGLKRRYVTLDYDLLRQCFTMHSAADDQDLALSGVLPVLRSTGLQAGAWDLHVGATLYVLGKQVTLLKAEGDTAAWIEQHAK